MFHSLGALLFAGILIVTTPGVGAASRPADDAPAPPTPPALFTRQIEIAMKDHLFVPASFDVTAGETITFVFTNTGTHVHDALIGDKATQEQHEAQMQSGHGHHGGQGHSHGNNHHIVVAPGQTDTLVYFFDRPGPLEIGCHQTGHYRLGMKAALNVVPGVPGAPQAG